MDIAVTVACLIQTNSVQCISKGIKSVILIKAVASHFLLACVNKLNEYEDITQFDEVTQNECISKIALFLISKGNISKY